MKPCPHCRRNQFESATTCSFCHRPLSPSAAPSTFPGLRPAPPSRPTVGARAPSSFEPSHSPDREPHTLNPFVLIGRCVRPSGRFSRSEFAVVYLGAIATFWGLLFAGSFLAGIVGASDAAIGNLAVFLTFALVPVVLIASIGGGIRRLHDLGKPGWYLLLGLVPCAGALLVLYLLLAPGDSSGAGRSAGTPGWAIAAAVLVIGVFGVGMIAAIAIPSLLRARISANESAVIGDLRAVLSAEAAYRDANGGLFEGRLECLASPGEGCLPAGGSSFLDPGLAEAAPRHGYRGRLEAGPTPEIDTARSSPTSVVSFAYVTQPVQAGQTGVRSFCGDSSGLLCYRADGGDIPVVDGACPRTAAECTPLRH